MREKSLVIGHRSFVRRVLVLGMVLGGALAASWNARSAEEGATLLNSTPGKKSRLAWSPSGNALAFLTTANGETRLMVQDPETNAPADLGAASAYAWAPDGRALAVARTDGVFLRAWPGVEEKRLATGAEPVFTADGKSVVFVRDSAVFIVPAAGGAEQKLTATTMIDTSLACSQSGIFVTGNGILWQAAPGQGEKMIRRNAGMGTAEPGMEYYVDLAASPDGKRLVIVSSGRQDAGGGLTVLILVNADGSDKKTIGPGLQPCWLPDGTAILYSAKGDLFIYDLASGESKALTAKRAANHAWPTVAPDGKRLAFTATLTDTTGDGKTDWRDEPSVFSMLVTALKPQGSTEKQRSTGMDF